MDAGDGEKRREEVTGMERMNPFRSYTFTWWQIGIFKLSLLVFGIAIGAYWHEFFGDHLIVLLVIAIVTGLYIAFVSLGQFNGAGRPPGPDE